MSGRRDVQPLLSAWPIATARALAELNAKMLTLFDYALGLPYSPRPGWYSAW